MPNRPVVENFGSRIDYRSDDMFRRHGSRDCAVGIERPQRRAAVWALAALEVPPRKSVLQCQERRIRPEESFQGRGLQPDVPLPPDAEEDEPIDLEAWRASFRFIALNAALARIDLIGGGPSTP